MLPDEISISLKFRPKLLLLSPVAVLIGMGIFYLPWGAESAPAWVQAVGSVAAIIAAFLISNRQERQAILERQRQNYRYMFRAYQAASNAAATITSVLEDLAEGRLADSNVAYYRAVLSASETELSAFNFSNMVDYEFGSTWMDIGRHVTLIKSRIDAFASTPEAIPRAMQIPQALEVVEGLFTELQEHLLEHSRRVGPLVYQDQHL